LLNALTEDREAVTLVELWHALANVYLGGPRRLLPEDHPQRDPLAAERAARRATTVAPDGAYGWYLLGLALQAQGRYADAIAANGRALTLESFRLSGPGHGAGETAGQVSAHTGPLRANLATCRAMLGDFEAAWPLYEQALTDSGNSPIVLIERAEAYHRAGMRDRARADLQRAMELTLGKNSKTPVPACALPLAWAWLTFPDPEVRDPRAALEVITALRRREAWRNGPTVLVLLSFALALCGEPAAAFEVTSQLQEEEAPSPFQDAVMALVLHALGRPEQATRHLLHAESAARRSPHPDPRLLRLLEQVRPVVAKIPETPSAEAKPAT
jgi:tetratricopeptide (TPR) repeat protein